MSVPCWIAADSTLAAARSGLWRTPNSMRAGDLGLGQGVLMATGGLDRGELSGARRCCGHNTAAAVIDVMVVVPFQCQPSRGRSS